MGLNSSKSILPLHPLTCVLIRAEFSVRWHSLGMAELLCKWVKHRNVGGLEDSVPFMKSVRKAKEIEASRFPLRVEA